MLIFFIFLQGLRANMEVFVLTCPAPIGAIAPLVSKAPDVK